MGYGVRPAARTTFAYRAADDYAPLGNGMHQPRGHLFDLRRRWLEAWGKPIAFYSDKHRIFRVNHPGRSVVTG
jgi:hypothetical protein